MSPVAHSAVFTPSSFGCAPPSYTIYDTAAIFGLSDEIQDFLALFKAATGRDSCCYRTSLVMPGEDFPLARHSSRNSEPSSKIVGRVFYPVAGAKGGEFTYVDSSVSDATDASYSRVDSVGYPDDHSMVLTSEFDKGLQRNLEPGIFSLSYEDSEDGLVSGRAPVTSGAVFCVTIS